MLRFRPMFIFVLALWIIRALAESTFAGPPFLTDDPEPVPFKNWEFYLFSTVDATPENTSATGPAFELNVGALPDLQLHMVIPIAYASPEGEPSAYGLGDMELGLKYRFIQETDSQPMVGVFPMLEIPTGDADRGLGNGKAWGKLPVWLQKSWEPWTTYGGGGYAINPASAARNYFFGGWFLQREFGESLTLGGEVFAQGRSSNDGRSFALFNLGGFFKITPDFNLLFSGGHTFAGGRHAVGYLGFYWTGGFGNGSPIHTGLNSLTSLQRRE
jgi:hypothetical protein